jgi:hypothetical protein
MQAIGCLQPTIHYRYISDSAQVCLIRIGYPESPMHHLPSDDLQIVAHRKTDVFSTPSNLEMSIRGH